MYKRDRETERDRQRLRQRDRDSETQKQRQRETDRDQFRETHILNDSKLDSWRQIPLRDTKLHIQKNAYSQMHREKQTFMDSYRMAERKTERKIEIQSLKKTHN